MIAQGNAISHGARAIEYSIDKDKARLVKVNDLPENIEPLAMWSRMMQHQHQCMKDRYNPKPITLNALRFEISPNSGIALRLMPLQQWVSPWTKSATASDPTKNLKPYTKKCWQELRKSVNYENF